MGRIKWGDGTARLAKPATREETEIVVFLSDVHIPYQDDEALQSAYKLIRKIKPHRIVLNGDIADFFQLSRFNTGLERLDDLQAEIDSANGLRRHIRKIAPNAVIHETVGNHDSRIISYVQKNARSLTSLRALDPLELFNYKEQDILWHQGHGFLLRPDFLVKHGTIIRQHAGYTAKAELELNGISGISGHTHRLGQYFKSGYLRRSWTEQGCLCRLDPDYVVGGVNWQQGFAVGQFSTKTSNYVVDLVQIQDGVAWYGGKAF